MTESRKPGVEQGPSVPQRGVHLDPSVLEKEQAQYQSFALSSCFEIADAFAQRMQLAQRRKQLGVTYVIVLGVVADEVVGVAR